MPKPKRVVFELKRVGFVFRNEHDWLCVDGVRCLWRIPEKTKRIWLTAAARQTSQGQYECGLTTFGVNVLDGAHEHVCLGWSWSTLYHAFGYRRFYVKCEYET